MRGYSSAWVASSFSLRSKLRFQSGRGLECHQGDVQMTSLGLTSACSRWLRSWSASRQLIGGGSLRVHDAQASLGYCFACFARGRGYATEAAGLLLTFGYATLRLHRIWAERDAENAGSIRVLGKLGMRQEGCFQHNCQRRGEWRNTMFFALLEDDWRQRAQADV